MRALYPVYGLWLKSDRPIPGLQEIATTAAADVHVWLGRQPSDWDDWKRPRQRWFVSSPDGDTEASTLTVWRVNEGDWYHLCYADGTEFFVNRSGTEVWTTWLEAATLEDTATYLLGPVLGFVLRLRGVICLHASGVAIGDRAIAFLGPPRAGKSTTVACFAARGCPVLTDDVVALVDLGAVFQMQPGYPHLRLWPSSVELLYGSAQALPRLTPKDGINSWWDKRDLDLRAHGHAFQQQPLPLAAVYLLDDNANARQTPHIEPVPVHAGLMTLVANTYVNYLLDSQARAREFDLLGRLVANVPLRRVCHYKELRSVTQLCDALLDDFRTLDCR